MLAKKESHPEAQRNLVHRSPVFYGWIVMAAGTFGLIMTSPGQTYSVSIFIEHIIKDLGLSRSLVSSLYSLGTLIGSLTLVVWGRQIDRRGPRRMVVLISTLFGIACIYMGYVQNALMLALGFILIRMLGQGSLSLVSQTVINQWWVRKRGMVMGISGLIMALLGIGAFPNLVYALILAFGWRLAYCILGLALLLLMAPTGLLLFRNRPEDYDLQPDGAVAHEPEAERQTLQVSELEENWTLKEAMQTRVFWLLAIGLSLFSMLATGLFFHLVSIFETRGLSAGLAATVFVPVAFTAAAANLAGGFLTDRISVRFLLAFGLLLQGCALVMAQVLQGTGTALLFGIILGATNGVGRVVEAVVWPTFYGRQNLGSIYGFTSAVGVLGAALGPLPFGIVFDSIGSYQSVLLASAGICLLFGLVCLSIRKPRKLAPASGQV